MALDVIPPVDHNQLVEDKIATQYKESSTMIAHIKALLSGVGDLEETYQELIILLDIDNAKGVQLDLIGRIVGQPRTLVVLTGAYFTFAPLADPNQPENFGFGDSPLHAVEPEIGGIFRSAEDEVEGGIELPDTLYRTFIKAKILNNHTMATPEEAISYYRIIFGWIPVIIKDGHRLDPAVPGDPNLDEPHSANVIVEAPREISVAELLVLQNLPPKTVGVAFQHTSFRGTSLPVLDPSLPADLITPDGSLAEFVVEQESGPVAISYQWYQDGAPVGSNQPTYGFTAVLAMDGEEIYCDVTNVVGTISSRIATLTVIVSPPWVDAEDWNDNEPWYG